MLNSIYEQKMALAAYATEHGGITVLSSHQLEIVQTLISLLKPIEEDLNKFGMHFSCDTISEDFGENVKQTR